MSAADDARRLLAAITPGPWEADGAIVYGDDGGEVAFVEASNRNRVEYSPNAEFIAAAPTLMAGLLAELGEAQRDRAFDALEARDMYDKAKAATAEPSTGKEAPDA